jgi:hypothetical protein
MPIGPGVCCESGQIYNPVHVVSSVAVELSKNGMQGGEAIIKPVSKVLIF